MIREVTDDTFELHTSTGLVLVDFWATWCAPCKVLAPVLEEFANESKQVKVVKADIESCPQYVKKYNVRGIPTLMLFRDGEVLSTNVGLISKDTLHKIIRDNT